MNLLSVVPVGSPKLHKVESNSVVESRYNHELSKNSYGRNLSVSIIFSDDSTVPDLPEESIVEVDTPIQDIELIQIKNIRQNKINNKRRLYGEIKVSLEPKHHYELVNKWYYIQKIIFFSLVNLLYINIHIFFMLTCKNNKIFFFLCFLYVMCLNSV